MIQQTFFAFCVARFVLFVASLPQACKFCQFLSVDLTATLKPRKTPPLTTGADEGERNEDDPGYR